MNFFPLIIYRIINCGINIRGFHRKPLLGRFEIKTIVGRAKQSQPSRNFSPFLPSRLSHKSNSSDRGRKNRLIPGSPSLRTGHAGLPHPALQSVVSTSGLAGEGMGCYHGEQPNLCKEGFPSFTPFSRAANMRSVHTSGFTHDHRARMSPSCLGSTTDEGFNSSGMSFTPPPSCLPLLHGHYPASSLLWRL